MLLIYPFSLPDQDQALKNAHWIAELGEYKSHDVLILSDRRCERDIVKQVIDLFNPVFKLVQHRDTDIDVDGWPEGANHMFTYAAGLIQNAREWPCFLWLEPDAIPIRPEWLDELAAEYRQSGKLFMGEKVDLGEKRPDVPIHMSGVGIYQNPVYLNAGEAWRAYDIAWDIAAKDQILPKCHFTKRIQHYWKHGTFQNLDGIRPETVVFHSSKDGSLIDLLKLRGRDTDTRHAHNVETVGSTPTPATIKVLPHNGIWVLEGDTIISDEVERYDRLDFDPLLPHILPLIRPGDTVVDAGAFIGDHTLAYSKQVGREGVVYAFEPNPVAFKCLHHNMRTCGNVVMHNLGLTDEPGIVPLCCADGNSASAHIGRDDNKIADVTMTALELAVPWKVNFIKIDVEGYELKVLKGAGNLINKCKPTMVIEINEIALKRQGVTPEDVVSWVVRHGYAVSILHQHKDAPFYDILAKPNQPPEIPSKDKAPAHALTEPTASSPVAVPTKLMVYDCIEYIRKFAEASPGNKAIVSSRLVYAGLRSPNKKKKYDIIKTNQPANGKRGATPKERKT